MTKDQELQILRNAAEALGPDSYLGPWLKDLLPDLETHIRADLPPISFREMQRYAVSEMEKAAKERDQIVAAAKDRAEDIKHEAWNKAANTREYLRNQLQNILKEL